MIYILFWIHTTKDLCHIAQQAFGISKTEPLSPVEKVGNKAVCDIPLFELNISESCNKVVWKWLNYCLVFLVTSKKVVKQVSWTCSLVPKGEEEVHIGSYLENLGFNQCYEALEHHALLALLTRNSAYGGLNVFDTGYSLYKSIFNMEHGWIIWCFFLFLLGKKLRKGQERIFHLKRANDRDF